MGRTALFSRVQPGGVFTVDNLPEHPGDIWFVDSGATATGADSVGYGKSPDAPFLTLDYAVSQCAASKGDVIYLMPGHAETISTAALSPGVDVAGVKIVGLGQGASRPTFTFTHVDANIIVSAAGCSMRNILFLVGVDNLVEAVDVNSNDFLLEDCEVREGSALQATTSVDITGAGANACDRTVIRNCKIISEAAGAVNAIQISQVVDGLVIEGCWISGDFSDAAISSNQICTNMLIRNNVVRNVNAADWAIELSGAATGLCVGNRLMSDAAATCLDPGSLMCVDNEMVNAIDRSSIPVPTTATGVLPTGAIGAASFAAGAIDAAAIANDAIDATAIATGAVDADAIADNAIDAGAIAADAITNAKIADNALAGEQFALSAGEKTTDGVVITRATAALPQTATAAIFTVTGLVLLRRIVGYITTQIGAVANATKLLAVTTGAGADTDLCAALDINGYVVDSRLEITGTFANAMVRILDLPAAYTQATPVVIPPGTIAVNCAGSDGGTGRVRWSITYVPLETGAQVVAA